MTNQLEDFINACQDVVTTHYNDNYDRLPVPQIHFTGGHTFLQIRRDNSAFCFIAAKDGSSQALGDYKKGDIFKPASYKKPAKHARGNLNDDFNGMKNISAYGPHYMSQIAEIA